MITVTNIHHYKGQKKSHACISVKETKTKLHTWHNKQSWLQIISGTTSFNEVERFLMQHISIYKSDLIYNFTYYFQSDKNKKKCHIKSVVFIYGSIIWNSCLTFYSIFIVKSGLQWELVKTDGLKLDWTQHPRQVYEFSFIHTAGRVHIQEQLTSQDDIRWSTSGRHNHLQTTFLSYAKQIS